MSKEERLYKIGDNTYAHAKISGEKVDPYSRAILDCFSSKIASIKSVEVKNAYCMYFRNAEELNILIIIDGSRKQLPDFSSNPILALPPVFRNSSNSAMRSNLYGGEPYLIFLFKLLYTRVEAPYDSIKNVIGKGKLDEKFVSVRTEGWLKGKFISLTPLGKGFAKALIEHTGYIELRKK